MAGFENDIVFAKNADFTQADNQAPTEANGLATDGQLWIGVTAANAGGTHINVGTITSPDASVIVGYSDPDITLTAVGVSPTTFDADSGTATPALNVIQLLGGSNGIDTTAAGNTVTFNFDVTEQPTIPTSFPTPSGTATPALNALTFANGTGISISGAGSTVTIAANGAVIGQTITGTTGGALSPTAGNWNILAGTIAAGSTPIQTNGAVSTLTINVQRSQAIAAADSTKVGLSNFNSAQFSVDSDGFVSLAGGGLAIDSIGVQTGTSPIVPTAGGLVTINGATVMPGTNPVRTNGTGANTMAVEVQISQALAATDATKIGLCNFNSAQFTVDANGFVSATGSVPIQFTADSGTAAPAAGNINLLGSGSITTTAAGSTVTTALTGLTNHAVLVGAGTSTITKVGPTATAGQILQSAGAAADPVFSTATYPSTTTVNQLLYSSSTNVVAGLTAANSATLVSNSTGVPVWSSTMTNGQVIIGSTGATPTAATLTAGAGISITNAAASITIAANSSATWTDQSGAFAATSGSNYFITGTSTATLPGSPTQGDTIRFIVDTTNVLTITGNTGQVIRLGSSVTAAAGSVLSTARGDAVTLVYRSTGTAWIADSGFTGNWTI